MRKIFCILTCLIVLAGAQFAFAGGDVNGSGSTTRGSGSGSDVNGNFDIKDNLDVYQVFEEIVEQIMSALQADFVNGQGGMLKPAEPTGCLVVDLELPDSAIYHNPITTNSETGTFYIENCAEDSAYVLMEFEFTVHIDNELDTVLTIDPMYLYLHEGEEQTCTFDFPILPFAAQYTLCITAVSDGFTASDCETMKVVEGDDPGSYFSAIGYLFQGSECVLFMELGDTNAALVLENYGDFGPDDTVVVTGMLVGECGVECPDALACVIDNTIEEYYIPPPPPYYEGCGVLSQGVYCVLFHPEVNTGEAYILADYSGFGPGDSVYVAGDIYYGTDTLCTDADGYLFNSYITTCDNDIIPESFAGCGIILEAPDCTVFKPFDYFNVFYILSDFGGYVHGDTVYVEGETATMPDGQGCSEPVGYLVVSTITECENQPFYYIGCGELVQGTDCVLFTSPDFGDFASSMFTLLDYGDFVVGDQVLISGEVYFELDPDCPESFGYIVNDLIAACQDTLPNYFSGCGAISGNPACLVFEPFGQQIHYLLSDYGTYVWGDTIYVQGAVSTCQNDCDADGCLDVAFISDCDQNVPDTINACGLLVEDQGCLIFYPDNASSGYLLDDYGEFVNGDKVYISGIIYDCGTPCNDVTACIANNVIQDCGTPDPTFEGCGLIVENDVCTLFLPDTWTNSYFVLSDYGEFQDGDHVYVSGTITGFPDTLECNMAVQFMLVDEISSCGGSNPSTDYSGLGYLELDGSCLVYYDAFEYNSAYVLENYGDFVEGDTVFVQGTVATTCDFNCSDIALCLLDNTIIAGSLGDTIMENSSTMGKITEVRSYPNPFNPMATISFSLPEPSVVHLEIYNILGQKVETLIKGEYLSGNQTVSWNGDSYSSGIYFYRIRTDHDVVTKKMLLSK